MFSNDHNVPFDHAAADSLIAACEAAATLLQDEQPSRLAWTNSAAKHFKGHFAELFGANQKTARDDASELVDALGKVAYQVSCLKQAAAEEQKRREIARAWEQEQADRNLGEKVVDAVGAKIFGHPEPDRAPASQLYRDVPAPRSTPRRTPVVGSHTGTASGGTSSASPQDLRSFAKSSSTANEGLRGRSFTLRGAYNHFQHTCHWGKLSAEGVFAGWEKYVTANDEDVVWANTVAAAFEQAGGSGDVSTLSNSAIAAALRAKGVDATRDDIVIDPPSAFGAPPTSGYADDPVNAATGNFVENEADLGFTGGCGSLVLTRTYNSFDAGIGAFGPGWSSWTEARLDFTDEAARMRLPDGRVVVFPRLGTGWDRAHGETLWLDHADEGYVATNNDGARWLYAADGLLKEQSRGAGTALRLVHERARLIRMEHERGRAIELTWDGDRVVESAATDGRRAAYAYDAEGRLVSVITSLGARRYEWDEQGLIRAVIDADGVVEAENTYDQQRRVIRQRSRFGRVSRFVYLPGNVTVVSDEDGARSNTWVSDARGRVIGMVDAHEQRQSTSYDARGNPVLVTERDGAVTVHEYDDRGRRVRSVTPSGADLTFGYDGTDRVTTVVTESGAVTTYEYEGDSRNPSIVVDPEGGRTRMRWDGGQLTQVTDPTDVVLTFSYDAHGDLVATTDALGNVARLERDETGRVTAAVTPSGHRTTFHYAPTGLLASRRDPDGAVWRFEHTAAGRMPAMIDPTGARTTIEYGGHGEEARTVDPLGRAMTRHLDDLGNLTSAELPDGSTWRFTHDALSRLTATTDPTGATWVNEFNETGDLSATIDPTGVRRSVSTDRAAGSVMVGDTTATLATRFDSLGRAIASEQADGSAAMATYDRCGRPVELLDAEGGLTRITRDAGGRPVEATTPTGAVTRYTYDACGRLAAVIDPTGARTTHEYDADGRVTHRILPTGEVAHTEYDPNGRITAHHEPGRGVARYQYDAAGRVKASSDTWYGRRKYRYDAAGQLVEVVNGNGGVTRYAYDDNGRCTAITDPLGNTTRREFDPMNRCVAETDPLGRTTRAGYDAAGRQVWQEDPEGHRTEWTYDDAGRLASTAVDGHTISAIDRDLLRRRVTITDHTRLQMSTHQLEWNRRGQLVRRSGDGQAVSWTYDADGRRTGLTTPDGHTTCYGWDTAGRLATVDHPLLGRVELQRDPSGRTVQATADGTIQTWDHHDGWVVEHTVGNDDGYTRTDIERDGGGRIIRIDRDGVSTSYDYDEACQLIEARVGGVVSRWTYDTAGRLIAETTDGETRRHEYDAASQLLATTDADGSTSRYYYDALARRTRTEYPNGRVRDLEWSPTGWLSSIADYIDDRADKTRLHVDATGEFASIDDIPLFWDTASPYAAALVQAGEVPVVRAGPVTGIGTDWTTVGWRSVRSETADPWSASDSASTAGVPGLPQGMVVGGAGELIVGHTDPLEWLGARVYDPASRAFLSADPLDAAAGSGWSGNPYSYAGNDPLHALDPTGLKPLTDADLNAYVDSRQGALHAAGDWMQSNWEYVAGGAMVIAGGALMATGVGGPAGLMLVSAGADTIIQKATTGEVNWGQVAVSGAAGGLGFGAGALAAKAGASATRVAITEGVVEGGISGGGNYMLGPGPHTLRDLLANTAFGGATGALPVGGAGDDITRIAGHKLEDVTPTPLGVIYLRTDTLSGNQYVGQSRSWDRFEARMDEHDADHLNALYEFDVLGRAEPGLGLDRLEEAWIRELGGPTNKGNPNGLLDNARHQMSEKRYIEAGGDPR